jgi:glycosyltransferase involved in cell wall biosynthesis
MPMRVDRVAFVGPLPPAPTGIATYDRAVLDGLDRIGFSDRWPVDAMWPATDRQVVELPAYRLGIYQLGNNIDFHHRIYQLVWHAPGLVVLHDLALDDLVRGLQAAGDPLGALAAKEAIQAKARLRSADAIRNEPLRTPWAAAVVRRARGIVVHAEFCARYLREAGCRTPIFVVPHPPVEEAAALERAEERGSRLRSRAQARGARVLIVAPGDMNEAKQLDAVLGAISRLPPDVHVALVGRKIPGYDAVDLAKGSGLGDRVTVEHDVTDEDFLGWIAAADVVVDLRHPHRGEVSGSLSRVLQIGRPAIVSATGTYLDVPEDTVLYVRPGKTDRAELAERIRSLTDDVDLRTRMGQAGRRHMQRLAETEATAKGYADAIEDTVAVARDPILPALERWASALDDLGVGPRHVEAGYGLQQVRALQSFKRSS